MQRWTLGGTFLLALVLALGQPACTRPDAGETAAPPPTAAATPTEAAETPATGSPSPEAISESPLAGSPSPGAASPGTEGSPKKEEAKPMSTDTYRGLTPFSDVKAPAITEVETIRFKTDTGDLVIEVYPQAAPNAAKRFVELVKAGFYDDTPIFRIVPGFVAQFGVNWRGDFPSWQKKTFNDDPSLFKLAPGTLAFAKAGPNTNSTQVFINYADNSPLRNNGNFTTFGRVVEGFENTTQFKQVGDPSMGLDQARLWSNGGAYLESLPANQKPTMIQDAEVVETKG